MSSVGLQPARVAYVKPMRERADIRHVQGPEATAAVWPQLEGHVTAALGRDMAYDADDIRAMLEDEEAVALLVCDGMEIRASCVVKPTTLPRERVLTIVTLGGEAFWEWAPQLQALLEQLMSHYDATSLRAYCRPGMAKWLKRLGWGELHQVMEYRSG